MTDRQALARDAVAEALAAIRAGDPKAANSVLIHAVHDGVWPAEIIREAIEQTGGVL